MGVVYQGHDPDIDRVVAIKTLHPHFLANEDRGPWLERFAREARAAGRCLHGNLVTIFDYLEKDGRPWLVMEYIESETLADRIRRQPLPAWNETAAIMVQLLSGLGAIHAAGIVHRDVKPANAMLLPDGRLKLADFGVARIEAMGATHGGLIGTPDYMSPEQFAGDTADHRADIFAAGVILFELLAGQKPFPAKGMGQLSQRVMAGDALRLRDLMPALPPQVFDLSERALARQPEARFQSAAEFVHALSQIAHHLHSTVGADEMDRTVIMARPAVPTPAPPPTPSQGGSLAGLVPKSALDRVESLLARQIGPIARVMVRKALNGTTDTNQLVERLSAEIGPTERERFRAAVMAELGNVASTADGSGLSDELLERLTAELLPHIGPIAKVLVRKAAKASRTQGELCQSLAGHIPDPAQRDAFVRRHG